MALPFTEIKFALLVEDIPTEFSCTLVIFFYLPFLHTALIGEPLSSDYIHVHVHLMTLYCMGENLSHFFSAKVHVARVGGILSSPEFSAVWYMRYLIFLEELWYM